MNSNEEQLDSLDESLKGHLSGRLDSQLGKAAAAFASHALKSPEISRPAGSAVRPWWIALLGTAAAAAVVAVAFSDMARRAGPLGPSHPLLVATQPSEATTGDDSDIERTVFWRTLDEGTVFIDPNTPARKLRRQQVEEVSWTDRQSGERRASYSVPQEEVMLVAYDKY
jgi:hypothetical protein